MKLLFVIDRAYATDDANINLVRGVLPYLTQTADNLSISTNVETRFLGHTEKESEADTNCFYFSRDEAVRTLYFSLMGLSSLQKVLRLVRHPINSVFGLCKALHIDWIAGAYRRHLERLCRTWKPDAVIAVTAPFYTVKAVAQARISCRKLVWMFDPYGTHYLEGGAAAQRQEKRCFERVDKVFVPELIFSQYKQTKSIVPIPFPGLIAPAAAGETPEQKEASPMQQGCINLVFVGSLYADIRNPAPLLRLVRALGENVHLTLVGGLYGAYTEAFHDEFDAFLSSNVTLTGMLDRQTAQRYLQQADVLVNLGNQVENQLPSKIFEYFATGLPVLNLKQIRQCPADRYMQKYLLAHTIDTSVPLTEETISGVARFLKENVGKRLPFERVKELYPENTPEAVAQTLLAALKGD